jgi:type I restriction enzyme S subunit
VAQLELPLPPLAEQRRIVAEIETQLTRLDAAMAALKRSQANLKRYRASALKAAVEGRLVGQAAEELGDGQLPSGWHWSTLRELGEIKGGITKGQRKRSSETCRSVPYLRVANVQRGWLDLTEVKYIEASDSQIQELRLLAGDILFNEGGDRDKLGRGWIWEDQIEECIHQNHVFRVRVRSENILPKFVSWYGNTAGQRYFSEEGKQTTNLASINMTKLGRLPIPVPPIEIQKQIVEEVERRLSVVEAMEKTVANGLARGERLRQAILRKAFAGELVPQDPNDEPASILLERIRAERSNSVPERKERVRRAKSEMLL